MCKNFGTVGLSISHQTCYPETNGTKEREPEKRRSCYGDGTYPQKKMAVVLETFLGDDGLVRKAKIKTANAVYDRPIHKLCLIATKEELDNPT